MLEAPLLSVFDLNMQLRERPNPREFFFLLHWACFVRWNCGLASFFSWNWPSKHSWITRIKSEEHWKLTGWWEEEVPMCPLFHTNKSWIVFFIIPVRKRHFQEACCGAREGGIALHPPWRFSCLELNLGRFFSVPFLHIEVLFSVPTWYYMKRSLPFPVHTHISTKKNRHLFHYYFLFFSFPASAVGPAGEGVGKGTRWEEWDEMEGEERSVCVWGGHGVLQEAVPVREITMVVICAIKKEGNTAEGMSLHSCEGLLITSPPYKPTPASPVLLSTGGEQKSPCRNWHRAAAPNPATVGTGAARAKMQTRDTCHPLPAARTFIILTFLLLHGNYSF